MISPITRSFLFAGCRRSSVTTHSRRASYARLNTVTNIAGRDESPRPPLPSSLPVKRLTSATFGKRLRQTVYPDQLGRFFSVDSSLSQAHARAANERCRRYRLLTWGKSEYGAAAKFDGGYHEKRRQAGVPRWFTRGRIRLKKNKGKNRIAVSGAGQNISTSSLDLSPVSL